MFALFRIITFPFALLPAALLRRVGNLCGDFVFYAVRFRKDIVLENLGAAFPDREAAWVRATARENYRHYFQTFFEILRTLGWSRERFLKNHRFIGLERLEAATAKGQGVVLLTSHLGNWELAINAIAATGAQSSIVVKHSRYRQVDEILKAYREKSGAKVLWEKHSGVEIFRSLRRGRVIGFVLDQFMGPPHGVPARFFQRMAGTAPALAMFLEKSEFPVLPVFSFRDAEGNATTVFEDPVTFGPLPENAEARVVARTQRFNDILESQIRRYPAQWLWLHRRWKPFRAESRWPQALMPVTSAILLFGWFATPGLAEGPITLPAEPAIRAPAVEDGGATDTESLDVRLVRAPAGKGPGKAGKEYFVVKNGGHIPFEVGERMEIALTYMNIPAGMLTTEVKAGPTIDGRPTFHLWGNAKSSKLVDAFYPVNNTVESFADRLALLPYRFILNQDEGPQTKLTRATFDYSKGIVSYWSERKSKKWGPEKINREDKFQTLARDMFSGFFAARTIDPKPGTMVKFPIYENGKNLDAQFTVLGRETLKTKAGLFPCWKLSLALALNNVLKQTGDVLLWISDDPKHFPVKFDAKIKIGSLTGTLVSVRDRADRDTAGTK